MHVTLFWDFLNRGEVTWMFLFFLSHLCHLHIFVILWLIQRANQKWKSTDERFFTFSVYFICNFTDVFKFKPQTLNKKVMNIKAALPMEGNRPAECS